MKQIHAGMEPALHTRQEESMSVQMIAILVAVVIVAAIAFVAVRRKRTDQLRRRFGTEYERAVHDAGSVAAAEARLEARAKRVDGLHIRPLAAADGARFSSAWKNVQARFVDEPEGAVREADRLIGELMEARGYPLGDFDQRVEDISVDHPNVVMNYRAARDIAGDHAAGRASTEDLRQAMVHYRALFTELLETTAQDVDDAIESREVAERRRR
jgi:hypothetical protein